MLSNAYLLAKFRFATAENEPAKNLQKFANKTLIPPPPGDRQSRAMPGVRGTLRRGRERRDQPEGVRRVREVLHGAEVPEGGEQQVGIRQLSRW